MSDATSYDDIIFEQAGAVATLTLNRPEKRNPLSAQLVEEFHHALAVTAQDPGIRALVITGAGNQAFCSGGDIARLGGSSTAAPEAAPTAYQRRTGLMGLQRLILAIRQLEKPVIAAVNGVAVGGGCDLALACDIRIASTEARFGEVFARIGLFPGTGGTYLLPRVVGVAKALELIWTGDVIDAAEAERIGLVSRVAPHAELLTEAQAFAARLAEGPPLAIALAKSAVYRGLDLDVAAAFDYAATAESITLTSQDHREGILAFRERRKPTFEGR
ncbi:MAG: enoyl-CoA hydratase/isomerase family protein [Acidimicrobiales bacterium]